VRKSSAPLCAKATSSIKRSPSSARHHLLLGEKNVVDDSEVEALVPIIHDVDEVEDRVPSLFSKR